MIGGEALAALIPHDGAMVMLDRVLDWSETVIQCASMSHLDPHNPLRRSGRLAAICGLEYALQAAALHGALLAGRVAQRAGYVARLRAVELHVPFLDDPGFGRLTIEARLERQEANGMVYSLRVSTEQDDPLVTARASIALPPKP